MLRIVRATLSVLAVTVALVAGARSHAVAQQNPATVAIRPGDRLLVKIWLDSSYLDTVRVDEQGDRRLPRLGRVPFAGVAFGAVPDSVRSAYARILRTKSIEVTPLRRIGVVGAVRRPDVYYLDLNTSVRDAVALAGGVTEIGDPRNVSVIRNGKPELVKDWERNDSVGGLLYSGDEIVVGRQSFIERNAIAVVTAISVFASIIITLTRR